METQKNLNAKAIMSKKKNSGGIIILEFELYYSQSKKNRTCRNKPKHMLPYDF
jgi:hypothetical protein